MTGDHDRTRGIARKTLLHIVVDLYDDYFVMAEADERAIARALKRAAKAGCLVWTKDRVETTSNPRVVTRGRRVFFADADAGDQGES